MFACCDRAGVAASAQKLPPSLELVFDDPDLDAAYAKAIAASAVSMSLPEAKPWGQSMAYVRDPHSGLLIQLVQT